MDNVIFERLEKLEGKLDAIFVSVEKTRKYFFWTMVITIVTIVLPIVGLLFFIPTFLSTYTETVGNLSDLGL